MTKTDAETLHDCMATLARDFAEANNNTALLQLTKNYQVVAVSTRNTFAAGPK